MKNKIILKSLISLSFLLFLLPFLNTCSNVHRVETIETLVVDSADIMITENDTVFSAKELNQKQESKLIEKKNEIVAVNNKESLTFSFYDLLKNTLGDGELDYNLFFDKTFYPILGFLLVLIFTILMFVLSFINKIEMIKILTIINLVSLAISTILLYFCEVLESIDQIKIGYYLIIINFILIIIFCRKVLQENQIILKKHQ